MTMKIGAVLLLFCVSACTGGTPFKTATVMKTPEFGKASVKADGTLTHVLERAHTGEDMAANGTDGYGYVIGYYKTDPAAAAFAGLASGTNLGAVPAAASATMKGDYELRQLDNLAIVNGQVEGTTSLVGAEITLTYNFADKTLSGVDGKFTVNGTVNGTTLNGLVSYGGLDGKIQEGQMNASRAVAAFAGGDANTVYAGGFLVNK